MTPAPEQIRQALINTQQQPRNQASMIYEALHKEKPARKLVSHNVLWRGPHNKGGCRGCCKV